MNSLQNSINQKKVWTAWLSVPGIGRETFLKIKNFAASKSITLESLWFQPQKLAFLSQLQRHSLQNFQSQYTIQDFWDELKQKQIKVITILDQTYPDRLKQIDDPPWLLFVRGSCEWQPLSVSVVGTRKNTGYGQQAAEKIVSELVTAGGTIVSGFMYGIDMIAHKQAVALGGKTIAVLGYGFDQVTPYVQKMVYQQWLEKPDQVTFISEYPPATSAKPGLFPVRNRIVAGLSQATVVVEAAAKSGSLITAQVAVDNGRVVCAVPGSIFSRYSQGTKELINQGACLVSTGYQVLDELGWDVACQPKTLLVGAVSVAEKIVQEVAANPQTFDDLCQILQIPLPKLLQIVTKLEVNGQVRKQGNLLVLARP